MTRKTWVLAGAAVVVGVTVISGVVVFASTAKQKASSPQDPPVNTVKVERRSLSAMLSVDGTLTYRAAPDGSPYSVINRAGGTYTELPQAGQVISQGQVLYRVNDGAVMLLYGSIPAYRSLSAGAAGADVAELNGALAALGYAPAAQPSSTSSFFGSATTTALEKLQAAVGLPQTGTLTLGQAVFEPTAVRVTTLAAQLGADTRIGETVMQGTSTTHQVEVALDAAQQTHVAVGDQVTVTLPDNRTTPGVVSSVGTVARCPSSSAPASGSGSAAPGADTCPSAGAGSGTTPRISVDVMPADPATTGAWDQAPVQVTITTARVPGALVVPVTALLAQSGRGYAVEVVGAGRSHHLVGVSLGLFDDADGLVQVTGSGLVAGQDVVVPAI